MDTKLGKGGYGDQPIDDEGKYLGDGSSKPRREDFPDTVEGRREFAFTMLKWLDENESKKDPEKPKKEEPKVEGEIDSTADFASYKKTNILGMTTHEAWKEILRLQKDLKERGNFIFEDFDDFLDSRIRLSCLQGLDQVSKDFDLTKYGYGTIKVKTSNGDYHYYGSTYFDYSENECRADYISFGRGDVVSGYPGFALWSAEQFLSNMYNDIRNKHFDSSSDANFILKSIAIHEYGHNVGMCTVTQLFKDGIIISKIKEPEGELDNKINYRLGLSDLKKFVFDKAREMFPDLDCENDISTYGKTNDDEWFAEIFTSMYNPNPRKTALALREVLKGVFRK